MPYYPTGHHSVLTPAEYRIRAGIALVLIAAILWRTRGVVALSLKMAFDSVKAMFSRQK